MSNDKATLVMQVAQLRQSEQELQSTVASLRERMAAGENHQHLRAMERSMTLLTRHLDEARAAASDSRAAVADELKGQVVDLQADVARLQKELASARSAEAEERQAAAVAVSTAAAQALVKQKVIEAMQQKIDALTARDDMTAKYEEEVRALKAAVEQAEAEAEGQKELVRVGEEKIAFLERVKDEGESAATKRLEAQMESERRRAETIKKAHEEDAKVLKQLRVKVMETEVALGKAEGEVTVARDDAEYARGIYNKAQASFAALISDKAALLNVDLDPLRPDLLDNRDDPAGGLEEWEAHVAEHKSLLEKAIVAMQKELAEVPGQKDRIAAQCQAQLEVQKKKYETLIEQMKSKVNRKVRMATRHNATLHRVASRTSAGENTWLAPPPLSGGLAFPMLAHAVLQPD